MRTKIEFAVKKITPLQFYLILLFITFLFALGIAFKAINPLDANPFNGTHQLYTAMTRMLQGDELGSDFVVFHGPTWAAIFFPVYFLSNGDIFAVEFAKYFFNILLLPAISGYFVLYFAKHLKYIKFYLFSVMIIPYFIRTDKIPILLPGFPQNREVLATSSNAGLRYSAIFLLILITLNSQNRDFKSRLSTIFFGGFILGLAIDQAVYFTIAAIIVMTISYLIFNDKTLIIKINANLAFMWVGFLFFCTIFSKFSIISLVAILKFYFIQIPRDQLWFFGTWPSKSINSWLELLGFIGPIVFILISIFSIFIREANRSKLDHSSLIAGQILLINSILTLFPILMSYKGYHYLIPSLFAIPISLVLLHSYICVKKDTWATKDLRDKIISGKQIKQKINSNQSFSDVAKNLFIQRSNLNVFILVLILALFPVFTTKIVSKSTSLNWQQDIKAYSNLLLNCENSTNIWSDYPGYFLAKSGCKLPTGDLMIHALDGRRDLYQRNFINLRPRYVETARVTSLAWMPWLRTTNWDFYKFLYENYSPISNTSHSILWEKDKIQKDKLQVLGTEEGINLYVSFPTEVTPPKNARVGYLKILYDISRPLSFLPMLGTLGSYGIEVNGSMYPGEILSLSPYKKFAEFPVFFSEGIEVIKITPINNSPRFLTALQIQNATITWMSPVPSEIANFNKSLE